MLSNLGQNSRNKLQICHNPLYGGRSLVDGLPKVVQLLRAFGQLDRYRHHSNNTGSTTEDVHRDGAVRFERILEEKYS